MSAPFPIYPGKDVLCIYAFVLRAFFAALHHVRVGHSPNACGTSCAPMDAALKDRGMFNAILAWRSAGSPPPVWRGVCPCQRAPTPSCGSYGPSVRLSPTNLA